MEQTATNAAPIAPPAEPRPIVKTAPREPKPYWQPKVSKSKAKLVAQQLPKQPDQQPKGSASVETAEQPKTMIASNGRKVGRPPKRLLLTPERKKTILDAIELGMTIEKAAILGGVSYATVHRFKETYPDFAQECKEAEGRLEARLLRELAEKGRTQWTQSAWMLERRLQWVPISRQEVTGANGGPIQHLTIAKHLLAKVGNAGDRAKAEPKRAEVVDV